MGKRGKDDFPNLRNENGGIGSETPARSAGEAFCNTCGGSGSTGTLDVYDTATGQWNRGATCFSHNVVAH
jgi:hypothetical protein